MSLSGGRSDFLVLHLTELVRMCFMAATADSDPLRLEGETLALSAFYFSLSSLFYSLSFPHLLPSSLFFSYFFLSFFLFLFFIVFREFKHPFYAFFLKKNLFAELSLWRRHFNFLTFFRLALLHCYYSSDMSKINFAAKLCISASCSKNRSDLSSLEPILQHFEHVKVEN